MQKVAIQKSRHNINPFSEKIARNTSAERGLRFLGSRRDLDARSFVRSYVRSLVRRENYSATQKSRRRENFRKKSSGRRDRFRPKIVEIGAILAIFKPFEVQKFDTPLFGEFGRSSQDLCESDNDLRKSRDDWLNSPKSGVWMLFILLMETLIRPLWE